MCAAPSAIAAASSPVSPLAADGHQHAARDQVGELRGYGGGGATAGDQQAQLDVLGEGRVGEVGAGDEQARVVGQGALGVEHAGAPLVVGGALGGRPVVDGGVLGQRGAERTHAGGAGRVGRVASLQGDAHQHAALGGGEQGLGHGGDVVDREADDQQRALGLADELEQRLVGASERQVGRGGAAPRHLGALLGLGGAGGLGRAQQQQAHGGRRGRGGVAAPRRQQGGERGAGGRLGQGGLGLLADGVPIACGRGGEHAGQGGHRAQRHALGEVGGGLGQRAIGVGGWRVAHGCLIGAGCWAGRRRCRPAPSWG